MIFPGLGVDYMMYQDSIVYLSRNLFLDLHLNRISKDGFMIPFSATQKRILDRLTQCIGSPVSTKELILYTWGEGEYTNEGLYQQIRKIRSKLEDSPSSPKYLLSIHGVGYMLLSHL